jgi:hypothetical protein
MVLTKAVCGDELLLPQLARNKPVTAINRTKKRDPILAFIGDLKSARVSLPTCAAAAKLT